MSVRPDGRVFEALALAEYESAWGLSTVATKRIVATLVDRGSLRPIDEVLLALAAARLGMTEQAAYVGARAEKHRPADVPTASFLLQLQAMRGTDVGDALRFILAQRAGKGWRTTMEGAYAILGLSAILDRAKPGDYATPGRIVVEVNGQAAKEIALPASVDPTFDGRVSVPEPPQGWSEKAIVRLTFEGKGTAFYTAALEALIGGEDPAPVKRGLEIAREYFEKDGEGWKPVRGTLRASRPVLVHLEVRSTEPREYVMVTDPRPDGFEPVDASVSQPAGRRRIVEGLSEVVELSDGWQARLDEFRRGVRGDAARESAWGLALLREIIQQRRFRPESREEELALPPAAAAASVEHRGDRTLFFLNALPAGTVHLYYLVRAEFPGEVHALPPQATPMYEPEVYGSGAEARLTVVDEALVREPAAQKALAPGVEGLLDVLEAVGPVDADELIALIPSNPRIGDLLMRVMTEPGLRAWLSTESAAAKAGSDLRERIEAARRDVSTRRLCAEALGAGRPEWLPAVEEAMGSDRLARRVLAGATVGDVQALDDVLSWVSEDRAMRLVLAAAAQRLRGSAQVGDAAFRPVSVAQVFAALGSKAPAGDALARWKLSQRGSVPAGTVRELAARLERDLAIVVKLVADPELKVGAARGRVSEVLDQTLGPAQLFYRVRDGAVWIGPLEEIMK